MNKAGAKYAKIEPPLSLLLRTMYAYTSYNVLPFTFFPFQVRIRVLPCSPKRGITLPSFWGLRGDSGSLF